MKPKAFSCGFALCQGECGPREIKNLIPCENDPPGLCELCGCQTCDCSSCIETMNTKAEEKELAETRYAKIDAEIAAAFRRKEGKDEL